MQTLVNIFNNSAHRNAIKLSHFSLNCPTIVHTLCSTHSFRNFSYQSRKLSPQYLILHIKMTQYGEKKWQISALTVRWPPHGSLGRVINGYLVQRWNSYATGLCIETIMPPTGWTLWCGGTSSIRPKWRFSPLWRKAKCSRILSNAHVAITLNTNLTKNIWKLACF